MVNDPNIKDPNKITPEDIINIYQQPCALVDHFYMAGLINNNFRLSLAETVPQINIKVPRGNFILTLQGVIQLHAMLDGLLKNLQKQQQEQEKAPEIKAMEREKLN